MFALFSTVWWPSDQSFSLKAVIQCFPQGSRRTTDMILYTWFVFGIEKARPSYIWHVGEITMYVGRHLYFCCCQSWICQILLCLSLYATEFPAFTCSSRRFFENGNKWFLFFKYYCKVPDGLRAFLYGALGTWIRGLSTCACEERVSSTGSKSTTV